MPTFGILPEGAITTAKILARRADALLVAQGKAAELQQANSFVGALIKPGDPLPKLTGSFKSDSYPFGKPGSPHTGGRAQGPV